MNGKLKGKPNPKKKLSGHEIWIGNKGKKERERGRKKNKLCGINAIQMHHRSRWALCLYLHVFCLLCVCLCVYVSHSYQRFDANKRSIQWILHTVNVSILHIFTPKHMLQFFFWLYFHLNYLRSNSIRFPRNVRAVHRSHFYRSISHFLPTFHSTFTCLHAYLSAPTHSWFPVSFALQYIEIFSMPPKTCHSCF